LSCISGGESIQYLLFLRDTAMTNLSTIMLAFSLGVSGIRDAPKSDFLFLSRDSIFYQTAAAPRVQQLEDSYPPIQPTAKVSKESSQEVEGENEKMTQETVIFMGAGAPRALGLPLTNDILPGIVKGLQDETLFGNDASSRLSLRASFTAMLPGLGSAFAHPPGISMEALPPITDVISGSDHLLLTSNSPLPDLEMSDLLRGRGLLDRAIFEQVVRKLGRRWALRAALRIAASRQVTASVTPSALAPS
jgi:hypothetical protein